MNSGEQDLFDKLGANFAPIDSYNEHIVVTEGETGKGMGIVGKVGRKELVRRTFLQVQDEKGLDKKIGKLAFVDTDNPPLYDLSQMYD